jgi:hypothetical protein
MATRDTKRARSADLARERARMSTRDVLRQRALSALLARVDNSPHGDGGHLEIWETERGATKCLFGNFQIVRDYFDLKDDLGGLKEIALIFNDSNEPRIRAALARLMPPGGFDVIQLTDCNLSALDVGAWLCITKCLMVYHGNITFVERASDWIVDLSPQINKPRKTQLGGGELYVFFTHITEADITALERSLDGRRLNFLHIKARGFLREVQFDDSDD